MPSTSQFLRLVPTSPCFPRGRVARDRKGWDLRYWGSADVVVGAGVVAGAGISPLFTFYRVISVSCRDGCTAAASDVVAAFPGNSSLGEGMEALRILAIVACCGFSWW